MLILIITFRAVHRQGINDIISLCIRQQQLGLAYAITNFFQFSAQAFLRIRIASSISITYQILVNSKYLSSTT